MMDFLNAAAMVAVAAPFASLAFFGGASLLGLRPSESTTARLLAAFALLGFAAVAATFFGMLANPDRPIVLAWGDWVHLEAHSPAQPEGYHFAVKFIFDRLSLPFVALTYVLSGTIASFAVRYMHREPGYNRFFVLYSIFQSGMVTAGLAGTIETLFFGWELVGLSSALLVGFFHERPAPVRNALRVWVVCRVSDAALVLAALYLHLALGSGDFEKLIGYGPDAGGDVVSWPNGVSRLDPNSTLVVGILLLIAAAGKSALVPFSGWLPRAMEGPTPSSAVFYGALSVHLGAFLLLRLDPVFEASPILQWVAVALGLTTALFAALSGRVQTDIKSILAFASLTQVGLIVAEIGFGWRYIPLIHLVGHGCLRTLQFVRAPSALRDHHAIEKLLGGHRHRPSPTGPWRNRLYHFALERGHLDSALDRFAVGPFLALFRTIDRLERRILARLNPTPPETPPERRA